MFLLTITDRRKGGHRQHLSTTTILTDVLQGRNIGDAIAITFEFNNIVEFKFLLRAIDDETGITEESVDLFLSGL